MTKSIGLTVITGPSGVGKGTLVSKLLEKHKSVWLSISATTRSPREGERDGIDYLFLEKKEFQSLVQDHGFLEWAEFAGNFYGTPKDEVDKQLSKKKKVLLEIELEGARQVRKSFPNAFQIFIAPPSFKELEKRICKRATDSEDAIRSRMKRAKIEIHAQEEFDAVVINDDIKIALFEIENLMGLVD